MTSKKQKTANSWVGVRAEDVVFQNQYENTSNSFSNPKQQQGEALPPFKPAPGFKELADAKNLLAYLNCGQCTLQYCKEDLGVSNPLEIVALLRIVGKKAGFKIIYCRKSSTLKLTNTSTEPLRFQLEWILKSYLLAWKYQLLQTTTWIISKIENAFVGSNFPKASRIVDWCLFFKDLIEHQIVAPGSKQYRGEI